MQYINKTTLLELLNCASLCTPTTATTTLIAYGLLTVKLQERNQSIEHSH